MTEIPGRALLLSNKYELPSGDFRRGSEHDYTNMKGLLDSLGFVTVGEHKNYTSKVQYTDVWTLFCFLMYKLTCDWHFSDTVLYFFSICRYCSCIRMEMDIMMIILMYSGRLPKININTHPMQIISCQFF